ncbi:DUF19 domain-containing protein [Caenorhabditis elegans]|uniref:DUF19 domain-containing protein n=1 Tax=Caenorhabditis elegans TaxID=6239 RepID=Q2HQL2_CAEEL|nr:DUF19 domain-containing protein [Caenorhabditis elegans]CAJ76959.1 DUF19 domain-containing protein [Caenorhabditis elegans]|eukprot:NP_001041003.1 Uncharacterized protein CELE_Y105C5A.8 [Caenorhabditis elegans]
MSRSNWLVQSAVLVLLLVIGGESAKFLDQVSKQALSVLHGSQRSGEVRQCTCDEMKDCYHSSKLQALDCFETCWKSEIQRFKLTDDPNSLKACFDAKKPFVDQVINCFQTKVKACTENGEPGVRVKEYDYKDMIKRVEDAVNSQINAFLRSIGNDNVKAVVTAGTAIAQCVKTCFLEKNKDGFCFNRIGCEPQIEDKNARIAIRQCSRSVAWKKEMETFCHCSSAAGINGLSSYCGMLNIIG